MSDITMQQPCLFDVFGGRRVMFAEADRCTDLSVWCSTAGSQFNEDNGEGTLRSRAVGRQEFPHNLKSLRGVELGQVLFPYGER